MKPEQLYQDLKTAAEKLGVTVAEKSFKNVGIRVESGLCMVRGKLLYIVDRNKTLHEKIQLLGGCLAEMPSDHIYMVPFMREYLEKLKRGD
ncbi:hypothetical protein [Desulfococcus sp.]|uniref:hypothetical protein n=1 Tax=Desulfococcus sp. TaxID=2025834 RepID=UPI0035945404